MTEALHRELQPLRGNVFDVTARLREAGVFFALNHLLHFYRGQMPLDALPAAARRGAGARGPKRRDAAGAQRAGRADCRAMGVSGAARAGSRWSPAATRTRCGASARRGPRRPAATRDEFLASLRARARAPGRRARRRRRRRRRRLRRDRRLSSPAWPASGRATTAAGAARPAWRSPRCRCRFSSCRWRSRRRGKRARAREVRRVGRRDRRARPPASTRCRRAAEVATHEPRGRDHRHRSGHRARRDARGELAAACSPASAAFAPTTVFDTDGYRSRIAAEVADRRESTRARRRSSGGAGRAAIGSACTPRPRRSTMPGCSTAAVDRSRVGVFLGAGTADLLRNEEFYRTWITAGIERARPSEVWNHFPSTPVDVDRRALRLRRAARAASSPPARRARSRSATRADAIRPGRADAVLAGGTDALARLTFSGFNPLRLMDPAPCRPFDRSRAGMNIGEGAGMLVLEDLDRARAARRDDLRRAGRLQPRLRGVPSDGARARGPAGGRGRRRGAARRRHQRRRGRSRQRARHRDAAERRRRGARRSGACSATASARMPVTSIKSMIGHCLGAAGAVEAAALALTVARGVIPPTIHHSETDPECARRRRRQRGARAAGALRRLDVARLRRQRLGARHPGVRAESTPV